ncbi:hypothetical protein [Thalassotalea eurytherma]|uniref:Uncharacterized protein n=1 Tax=Thalassotalea eurytherma TaxID=1144278 RepID=A0ABQ6GY35_9GAMM|nr:hypothetical protein [Thalassotalea eurytherma]GLX80853.1 hypothetical protein theurythT_03050 [Thalassotalea eurytherma]
MFIKVMMALLGLLILLNHPPLFASITSLPTASVTKTYICNSALVNSIDCKQINDTTLRFVARSYIENSDTIEECRLNPEDITCDNESMFVSQVFFIFYYPTTGNVLKAVVKKPSSLNTLQYTVDDVPTNSSERNTARLFKELNVQYIELLNTYSFKQYEEDMFYNTFGQSPEHVGHIDGVDPNLISRFGNCLTATSYYFNSRHFDDNSSGCQSFLNNWLDGHFREAGSPTSELHNLLERINISIDQDVALNVNLHLNKSFSFVIEFKDNSVLSIKVTLPDNPMKGLGLELEKTFSKTSSGQTLAQFIETSQLGGNIETELSYGEALDYAHYLGVADNCTTNLITIGREVDYLIIKTDYPDGIVTLTMQRLGGSPVSRQVTTCSNNKLD